MNNENRIIIAKDFMSKHRKNSIFSWISKEEGDDIDFLCVYDMLLKGAFGEIRILDNQYDEYGDISKPGIVHECVINRALSITEEPYIFSWEDTR